MRTYQGIRDWREPHVLTVLDDGMAGAEQVEVDVAALVNADLARGDDHDGVPEIRQVRRAVHAAHDDQAVADVLDRQARARPVVPHDDHGAVHFRDIARGGRARYAGGQTVVVLRGRLCLL